MLDSKANCGPSQQLLRIYIQSRSSAHSTVMGCLPGTACLELAVGTLPCKASPLQPALAGEAVHTPAHIHTSGGDRHTTGIGM